MLSALLPSAAAAATATTRNRANPPLQPTSATKTTLVAAILRRTGHLRAVTRLQMLQRSHPHLFTRFRRLLRSQAYNVLACIVGIKLLLFDCRSVDDLVHKWTPLHEGAFVMALAHWLVSLGEDGIATRVAMVGSMGLPPE